MKNKRTFIAGAIVFIISFSVAFAIISDWEQFKDGLFGRLESKEIQE